MNNRFVAVRKNIGLTQTEFGERLGVSRSAIANIEYGRVEPTPIICKLLCREFNVNPVWLETGAGEMFEAVTEDEAAAAFFAEALKESGVKNSLVHILAKLDEREWEALASIAAKILEEDRRGKE